MSITIEDLLKKVEEYNPEEVEKVKKAYEYAKVMHGDQLRESKEPYIIHPLSVANILADMHADRDTLCAGLLHDIIEDTKSTKEDISHEFNQDVANLVDGVTKMSKMCFSCKDDLKLANTRKIITGITEDVRIIIIKLSDRLHNMRTLQFMNEFKQKEIAMETMEIYAPLAYYIGAYRIKSELEDLSLRYLKPDVYKKIEEQKNKLEDNSNVCLQDMLLKIKTMLEDKNIPNEIKIRTKNIYGIYKRLNDGYKLSNIHDLLALKVMVDEVEDCYRTLYVIHSNYNPINDKFKDYICNPKTNMYRSLHSTVFGPDDRLVQTQIRTFEMDRMASFGLTAYWDIEKGKAKGTMQNELKEKHQFFKSLIEINSIFGDNLDFVNQVKKEVFADKVYVYTHKGEIIELPIGSTVIDFAYKLDTDIGNTMVGAIINDEYVNVDYILKNKDRVKIITDELSFGPRNDWKKLAKTVHAKRLISEYPNNMEGEI